MAEVRRENPQEAWHKVQAREALFVCAYENEDLCGRIRLEGAMTLGELNSRLAEIGKKQEIIFYCK